MHSKISGKILRSPQVYLPHNSSQKTAALNCKKETVNKCVYKALFFEFFTMLKKQNDFSEITETMCINRND